LTCTNEDYSRNCKIFCKILFSHAMGKARALPIAPLLT